MSDQRLKIETTVTFPDGKVFGMTMSIDEELYHASEVPFYIEDTMKRGAMAINKRIKETK